MTRVVFLTFLLLVVAKIQGCTKETFVNTDIQITILNQFGVFAKNLNTSGCVNPDTISAAFSEPPRHVYAIRIVGQKVPILFENAVEDMSHLSRINFLHTQIEEVKKSAFFNLPKLEYLDMSDNLIKVIEKDALNGLSITTLRLANNKLNTLESGCFANLPNLQKLELEHNTIIDFKPEWFTNSDRLSTLNLTDNYIQSLQKTTFEPFKSLRSIDLNNNNLQYIDKAAFKEVEGLEDLFLHNNRLRTLPPGLFKPLTKLNSLWIYGNNLTYIYNATLEELNPELSQMAIHTNPWQCGCYERILHWASKKTVTFVTGWQCYSDNNPACVFPAEYPKLCLKDREENLDALYYGLYKYNHRCSLK